MSDTVPQTTGEFLRHWAAEKPDHAALRWAGGDTTGQLTTGQLTTGQLTYHQLYGRSAQVANGLRAAGVGPADRIAFLDKNSPEQIELYFGAAFLNAVPAPVNFRLAPPEIATIVKDSD